MSEFTCGIDGGPAAARRYRPLSIRDDPHRIICEWEPVVVQNTSTQAIRIPNDLITNQSIAPVYLFLSTPPIATVDSTSEVTLSPGASCGRYRHVSTITGMASKAIVIYLVERYHRRLNYPCLIHSFHKPRIIAAWDSATIRYIQWFLSRHAYLENDRPQSYLSPFQSFHQDLLRRRVSNLRHRMESKGSKNLRN